MVGLVPTGRGVLGSGPSSKPRQQNLSEKAALLEQVTKVVVWCRGPPPTQPISQRTACGKRCRADRCALIHCNNSENLRKTDSWGIAFLPKAVLFNDASGHVPIARDQNPSLHGEPGAIQGDLSTHLWLHVALPAPQPGEKRKAKSKDRGSIV